MFLLILSFLLVLAVLQVSTASSIKSSTTKVKEKTKAKKDKNKYMQAAIYTVDSYSVKAANSETGRFEHPRLRLAVYQDVRKRSLQQFIPEAAPFIVDDFSRQSLQFGEPFKVMSARQLLLRSDSRQISVPCPSYLSYYHRDRLEIVYLPSSNIQTINMKKYPINKHVDYMLLESLQTIPGLMDLKPVLQAIRGFSFSTSGPYAHKLDMLMQLCFGNVTYHYCSPIPTHQNVDVMQVMPFGTIVCQNSEDLLNGPFINPPRVTAMIEKHYGAVLWEDLQSGRLYYIQYASLNQVFCDKLTPMPSFKNEPMQWSAYLKAKSAPDRAPFYLPS